MSSLDAFLNELEAQFENSANGLSPDDAADLANQIGAIVTLSATLTQQIEDFQAVGGTIQFGGTVNVNGMLDTSGTVGFYRASDQRIQLFAAQPANYSDKVTFDATGAPGSSNGVSLAGGIVGLLAHELGHFEDKADQARIDSLDRGFGPNQGFLAGIELVDEAQATANAIVVAREAAIASSGTQQVSVPLGSGAGQGYDIITSYPDPHSPAALGAFATLFTTQYTPDSTFDVSYAVAGVVTVAIDGTLQNLILPRDPGDAAVTIYNYSPQVSEEVLHGLGTVLEINDPVGFEGLIRDFDVGDTIDLLNIGNGFKAARYDSATNAYLITTLDGGEVDVRFPFGLNYAKSLIGLTSDGQGGSLLTISYNPHLQVGGGSTVVIDEPQADPVDFVDANGTLTLNPGGSLDGPISGFTAGDAIVLPSVANASVSYAVTGAGVGTLNVTSGGSTVTVFTVLGDYSNSIFGAASNGGKGSVIGVTPVPNAGTVSPGTSTPDSYTWIAASGGDWGAAANWEDLSAGLIPAAIAPGKNNLVSITGTPVNSIPGLPPTYLTITGAGAASAATVTGRISLAGDFAFGALVGSSAYLEITAGTVTVANAQLTDGSVQVAGGAFEVAGDATGSIIVNANGKAQVSNLVLQGGGIFVDSTSTFECGVAGGAAAGVVTVDPKAAITGYGRIADSANGTIENDGVIMASGGTLEIGLVHGPGVLAVATGGTLELRGNGRYVAPVLFEGPNATLAIDVTALPINGGFVSSPIYGFAPGDAIGLVFENDVSVAYVQTEPQTGTLTVMKNGRIDVSLPMFGDYSGDQFLALPWAGTFLGGSRIVAVKMSPGSVPSEGTGTSDSFVWTAASATDWNSEANWQNATVGGPATIAPGAHDTVSIANPGTSDYTIIGGPGNSASMTLSGNVALVGEFVTGQITVNGIPVPPNQIPGLNTTTDIAIASGGVTATTANLHGNLVQVSNAYFNVSGSVTVAAALTAANGGHVHLGSVSLQGGALRADDTSTFDIGGNGSGGIGGVTVGPGVIVSGYGGIANGFDAGRAEEVINDGYILAAGGDLTVGRVSGSGSLLIASSATLTLVGGGRFDTPIGFASTNATLALGSIMLPINGGTITSSIYGFAPSDRIHLQFLSGITVNYVPYNTNLGRLDVMQNGSTIMAPLMNGDFTGLQFMAVTSGPMTLDTEIFLACYARGTRISTPDGPRRIESLAVGDKVTAHFAGDAEIIAVGHRRVDCRRHKRPRDVRPVRIRRGAFAENMPRYDLLLSPDHAVYVDELMIPVKHLINNVSIVSEQAAVVDYYHIKLKQHDVLLANGMPAESFLDTGNGMAFPDGIGVVSLAPDLAALTWESHACAPMAVSGPALAAVRRRLQDRAMPVARLRIAA